jgi:hypothetical protein
LKNLFLKPLFKNIEMAYILKIIFIKKELEIKKAKRKEQEK